jgi:hypothetical protein
LLSDHEFFLRHPDCRHRIRRSGRRSWVVIKKVTADLRLQARFSGPPSDIGETTAFEAWCSIDAPISDATFRRLIPIIADQPG